jgi:ABC-type multidrug transport system fused ATPase/permease subunit
MKDEREQFEHMQEYAWKYFQVHASQRLTTFNFYLVISAVLVTGFFAVTKEDKFCFGVILGLLLMLVSLVFYKLDRRNRDLVGYGEKALKVLEGRLFAVANEDAVLRIFCHEESETARKKAVWWPPWRIYLTYARCFALVFFALAIAGGTCVAYCVFKMIGG